MLRELYHPQGRILHLIGHKQIIELAANGKPVRTDAVKLLITMARDRVEDVGISVY